MTGGRSGLQGLYNFMLAFLNDGVQSKTWSYLIEKYNVTKFSDFTKVPITDSLDFVSGFLACIFVGFLFMFIFTIIGCSYCCCKEICPCCRKPKKYCPRKMQTSRPCRYVCALLLLILALIMFSVVICNYVATSEVENKLGGEEVTDSIIYSMDMMIEYLNSTSNEIEQYVVNATNTSSEAQITLLDNIPQSAQLEVLQQNGAYPALYTLLYYTGNLTYLKDNLTLIDAYAASLTSKSNTLSAELATVRSDLASVLTSCGSPCSGSLTNNRNLLNVSTDYTEVESMAVYALAVQQAIDAGVVEQMQAMVNSVDQISSTITSAIGDDLITITQSIEILNDVLENFNAEFKQLVTNTNIDVMKYNNDLRDAESDLRMYSAAMLGPIYMVTTICFVICVLILVGLPVGLCCVGQGGTSTGKTMLSVSVVCIFGFGWLIMFFTTLPFLLGAPLETFLCRHLRTSDSTADEIITIARNDLGLTYALSLSNFTSNCKNDNTIYVAIDFANNVYDVEKELGNVTGLASSMPTNIPLPSVTVMNSTLSTALLLLYNQLLNIPYSSVYTATAKDVTRYSLATYSQELTNAAASVSNDATKLAMAAQAEKLTTLSSNNVAEIGQVITQINASANSAEGISDADVATAVNNLTTAQTTINTDSGTIAAQHISSTVASVNTGLEKIFTDIIDVIENTIGKCRCLYDSYINIVTSICAHTLHPFNSIWFTYGWFIVFAIIALFFILAFIALFDLSKSDAQVAPMADESDDDDFDSPTPELDQSIQLDSGSKAPTSNSSAIPIASDLPTPNSSDCKVHSPSSSGYFKSLHPKCGHPQKVMSGN